MGVWIGVVCTNVTSDVGNSEPELGGCMDCYWFCNGEPGTVE